MPFPMHPQDPRPKNGNPLHIFWSRSPTCRSQWRAPAIGSSVGSMFESSYGMKLGSLSIRVGVRYAKVLTPGSDVKEAFVVEPSTLNWMDGIIAVGINL